MADSKQRDHILTLACEDRVGLVATLAKLMQAHDCFIASSRTFGDPVSKRFYARIVFTTPGNGEVSPPMRADMAVIGKDLSAEWDIHVEDEKMRTLLLVSKSDHCANTLLYAARRKELPIEVVGIVSNHQDLRETFAHWGLPWFHVPVTKNTKDSAEQRLFDIIAETNTELTVLARYMQILSDPACRKLQGQCINIHHSFLPSFKGARPYHQAYARGVKTIGATAHYVTPDLDEGPIISQVTTPVDHAFTPADLIATGRHLEGSALLSAVKAHAEHRVFAHAGRTVMFER